MKAVRLFSTRPLSQRSGESSRSALEATQTRQAACRLEPGSGSSNSQLNSGVAASIPSGFLSRQPRRLVMIMTPTH